MIVPEREHAPPCEVRQIDRATRTVVENKAEGVLFQDHHALGIIIDNLLDNAIKYTPEGGSVAVSAGQEGMYATVVVCDTGITGAGLGLFFVKSLVDQHQGSITVDSEPGKGSSFTVRLQVEG